MAIYSLHHAAIGKSTQQRPHTAAAHLRYITRPDALGDLDSARFPAQPEAVARHLEVLENGDRRNARVLDKIRLALPRELDATQRAALVRGFAEDVTQGRASWLAAFHDRGKDEQNPHCHLAIRDRDPDTGRVVIGMSERGSTDMLREKWEQHTNAALAAAGSAERVDRRSLAAQGIRRKATIHEGPNGRAAAARGRVPQSRAINARNNPGSRTRSRIIDYPVIDAGRSRPAYNAALRNSEGVRDYWAAIDADTLRREFNGMGLGADAARQARQQEDAMNAGRAAPYPVTEEERQRRERDAKAQHPAQPEREPASAKGLFGSFKDRFVQPAKKKADHLRYAGRQFLNDPTKEVKHGLNTPRTGITSSPPLPGDRGSTPPEHSRGFNRPQTAEEQQRMGLGEAAYKRGIRPMFTGQQHPKQELPSNRESDAHHRQQNEHAYREARKGNPQHQHDYTQAYPAWGKSQWDKDRDAAGQKPAAAPARTPERSAEVQPSRAAVAQPSRATAPQKTAAPEHSPKNLAMQQPPAKERAAPSPEQDRRADQMRERMQQQRSQEKKRGLER